MPWTNVMPQFKAGDLHSGSKSGPAVKSRAQALAILMSEKKKAAQGDTEYEAPSMRGLRKATA